MPTIKGGGRCTQFLIEVSLDSPYCNSREAGLDSFYMRQLADISGLGKCPIEILPVKEFSLQDRLCSFSPLAVFKLMSLPVVLDPKVMIDVETQAATNTKDEETSTSTRKYRNSI